MTLCSVPTSLGTQDLPDALWWHIILWFRRRVAGHHGCCQRLTGLAVEFHRLARNFCATISEMSFGEAMGSTIKG